MRQPCRRFYQRKTVLKHKDACLDLTMMNAKGEQPRNHIEVPQVDLVLLSYPCFLIRNPYRLFYNRSS